MLYIYQNIFFYLSWFTICFKIQTTTKGQSMTVKQNMYSFYILLTVHHVMILGKWPTWRTVLFYEFIFIFYPLHVSSTSCSSSGETNCINTTSGNCHSVLVTVSCAGWEWNSDLHTTRQPTQEWQLPEVVLTQFVSPDDEHDALETCRELKIKINS
jgi:hypothetical protein